MVVVLVATNFNVSSRERIYITYNLESFSTGPSQLLFGILRFELQQQPDLQINKWRKLGNFAAIIAVRGW